MTYGTKRKIKHVCAPHLAQTRNNVYSILKTIQNIYFQLGIQVVFLLSTSFGKYNLLNYFKYKSSVKETETVKKKNK